MQYSTITLLALSASAFAAPQASSSADVISILSVLQTALPASVVSAAEFNSAAFSSQIASDFSHSETPSWFSALPTDIQTYLVPAVTSALNSTVTAAPTVANATNALNSTLAGSAQSSILSSIHAANSSAIAANGTSAAGASTSAATTAGSSSAGTTAASGASATTGSSGSSSTSSGGASLPTAVYGMGLAGAVGLVGLLAL